MALGAFLIAGAADDTVAITPEDIEMRSSDKIGVLTVGKVNFRFEFFVDAEDIDALEQVAENVSVFATVADYKTGEEIKVDSGIAVAMAKSGPVTVSGRSVYKYTLKLGGITEEQVRGAIGVRGFITYELDGTAYTVASDFSEKKNTVVPYDAVYLAYCDKTYEKDTDTNELRTFIASHLDVVIENGVARDVLENDKYDSLYNIEYFDGVLTVSLDGGDIPDWLISTLTVNGEERYFEIYEGKIRLVV